MNKIGFHHFRIDEKQASFQAIENITQIHSRKEFRLIPLSSHGAIENAGHLCQQEFGPRVVPIGNTVYWLAGVDSGIVNR